MTRNFTAVYRVYSDDWLSHHSLTALLRLSSLGFPSLTEVGAMRIRKLCGRLSPSKTLYYHSIIKGWLRSCKYKLMVFLYQRTISAMESNSQFRKPQNYEQGIKKNWAVELGITTLFTHVDLMFYLFRGSELSDNQA